MKPKDITIGQRYCNKEIGELVVYLGCGYSAPYRRIDKRLVIIKGNNPIGVFVKPPEKCSPTFWDNFYPVK